jgi:succinate dehydrogenase/fumarate reductase flavoprotein subunit
MSAGGVRANVKTMETSVPGLFIAGPVGGHQLGSISLAVYDGLVAGAQAARRARTRSLQELDDAQVRSCEERITAHLSKAGDPGVSPIQVKNQIRAIVSDNVLFAKSAESLNRALRELKALEQEALPRMRLRTSATRYNTDLVDALDVVDMMEVVEMVIHAALTRQESRGPHFREDFPFTDNKNWLKYVVVSRVDGRVKTRLEEARQKYVRPKPERVDYFANLYS